jgi:hypothetical protein
MEIDNISDIEIVSSRRMRQQIIENDAALLPRKDQLLAPWLHFWCGVTMRAMCELDEKIANTSQI